MSTPAAHSDRPRHDPPPDATTMRILLVNPNTSAHITARMVASAQAVLDGTARVEGATAAFGPAVIGSRTEAAVAEHSAVDTAVSALRGHDAVVLGVSIDSGLLALRELLDVPVTAMTESGLACAAMLGTRIGVLTLGPQMLPLYQELAHRYGMAPRVVSWRAPALPAAFVPGEGPDPGVADALVAALDDMIRCDGAEAVLLAGAVLSGYAAALAPRLPVPLVDGVAAAVLQAQALARLGAGEARHGSLAAPRGRASHGLSPALTDRLARP